MSEDVTVLEERKQTIREQADCVLARRATVALAEAAGFDETASQELGIVASELAANVEEHADSGELFVEHVRDGDRDGVRVGTNDAGPGFEDFEAAFADGESATGGLGSGLGAVNRLTDAVTVAATGEPDFGTRICADRWVRPAYSSTRSCPLAFGAASRPMNPGAPNGDSFVLKRWNDRALVGVIDGLGHGLGAHRAAEAAKRYVEGHHDQPFESLFEGAERACRGTRGVVMAFARFDWAEGTVTLAGVGNIDFEISAADSGYVMRRGVIGGNGPTPTVQTFEWSPADRMAIYSDGLTSRWDWADYPETGSATRLARTLLSDLRKDDDDATVVVVTGTE